MSKILLFTDNHFCETSSIVRKLGKKYTLRLENQIQSLNWVEDLAIKQHCSAVCCLGDFFNTSGLTEKELTALQDINWNSLPHYFLVGNHESEETDLKYSSTKVLEASNHFIIGTPSKIDFDNVQVCFLPYIIETDRQSLINYFGPLEINKKRVILSHNDLKGIQLGPVLTQAGFEISDIESNSNLFINGHLHNGNYITRKVLNLGNLTGQDFKEDATKYAHYIAILDTQTLQIDLIENPFALNFYKIDLNSEQDLASLPTTIAKQNAVVSLRCPVKLAEKAKTILKDLNVLDSRVMLITDASNSENEQEANLQELGINDDYLHKFIVFSKEKLEHSEILDFELAEICK